MEYGILSRIGRTLDKAGCSIISFDFDGQFLLYERIVNEVGRLHGADVATFYKMIMGVLYQTEDKRGIYLLCI